MEGLKEHYDTWKAGKITMTHGRPEGSLYYVEGRIRWREEREGGEFSYTKLAGIQRLRQ